MIEIVVLPVALLVWLLRHSPWLVFVIVLAAPMVALLWKRYVHLRPWSLISMRTRVSALRSSLC